MNMPNLAVFHLLHVILCWGMLGQLGHGVFRGFQPPQHFKSVLGHVGANLFTACYGFLFRKMARAFISCRTTSKPRNHKFTAPDGFWELKRRAKC